MSLRYLGGFITASYNPLKVPNPPTIGTVTPGNTQVSVAFTAPSNVGGSAITSFLVLVTDSSSGATFSNTGAASPIVVTGLTNGNTYTAKVLAVNSYGPSAFSAPSGGVIPVAPPEYKLFAWGRNANGQLGLNDVANRSSPVQVGALTDWTQTGTGEIFTVAVKTNGTLWSWGSNGSGQLGQNNTINLSSPVQIGALTEWFKVSAGINFCASIKTNGTLWTWGDGGLGRLGQNNTITLSSPVQVGALTDWAQVSGGSSFCAAIKTNGTLWTWGNNYSGQLGLGNRGYTNRSSPTQVGVLTDWSQVASGNNMCVAVKTNGTLFTWGQGSSGRLGLNNTIYRSSPTQVGALTDWAQASTGEGWCVAVKTNGTLWSWGGGGSGQLGQNDTISQSSPVQVGALTDWAQASGSTSTCVAIKTNGTLWAWGNNNFGQIGQNLAYNSRSSPVQIGASTNWNTISQGTTATHTLVTELVP